MSAREVIPFLIVAIACSAETKPETETAIPGPAERARSLLTLEELPPMPDYPRPRDGRLVVVSAGDFTMDGVWQAEAGICATANDMELYAEDDSSATLIVAYFPGGDLEGSYAISLVDSVEVGERAALVGVQIFHEREAFGFQAIDGSLEIQVVGEELTGRFTATVQEVQTQVLTRYVGVFSNVELRELSAEYCGKLVQEPADPYGRLD
jgi:hypothetical protein